MYHKYLGQIDNNTETKFLQKQLQCSQFTNTNRKESNHMTKHLEANKSKTAHCNSKDEEDTDGSGGGSDPQPWTSMSL